MTDHSSAPSAAGLAAALDAAFADVGTALDLLDATATNRADGTDRDHRSNHARRGSEVAVADLLAVLEHARRLINRAVALQTVAVAAVVEWERADQDARVAHPIPGLRSSTDPRVRESDARSGAAALVAGPLGISSGWARDRVEHATRLTGAALPVLAAQRAGVLDGYRVGIVLDELASASDDVTEQVAALLVPELVAALADDPSGQTAGRLRAKVRRVVTAVDPDAVRQRAVRARAEGCLRRWVAEPGVDGWEGTFRAEESATAWTVIDTLARRYVAEGRNTTIGQARADALLDLVHARATVTSTLTLTIPTTTTPTTTPPAGPSTAAPDVPGPQVPGSPATETAADDARTMPPAGESAAGPERLKEHDEPVDKGREGSGPTGSRRAGSRPPGSAASWAQVEAYAEKVTAWLEGAGPETLLPVGGVGAAPTRVPTSWIADLLGDALARRRVRVQWCHPRTGAWIDPARELDTPGYRPSARLVAFVKGRDGRCRFPGCGINVRYVDVDHVIAHPLGPTTAANLMALCRRHHRIKHRPGWQVTLHAGGPWSGSTPPDDARSPTRSTTECPAPPLFRSAQTRRRSPQPGSPWRASVTPAGILRTRVALQRAGGGGVVWTSSAGWSITSNISSSAYDRT